MPRRRPLNADLEEVVKAPVGRGSHAGQGQWITSYYLSKAGRYVTIKKLDDLQQEARLLTESLRAMTINNKEQFCKDT